MGDLFDFIASIFQSINDDGKGDGPWDDIFHGIKRREPRDGFIHAIKTWEGGYQAMRADIGNWVRMPDGERRLIGTNLGVTPGALALHRGVQPHRITVQDMKALKIEEAAGIGMTHYYRAPGFDRLPYVPATEVLVDCGWGSGPRTAVRWMQRIIGVEADGSVGPLTIEAYVGWLRGQDHEDSVRQVHGYRKAFYTSISDARSGNPRIAANAKFRQGWYNRADHYLPGGKWWKGWVE